METKLIQPNGLEFDCVVPQCLDDQFVSDHVFKKMIDEDLDFRDSQIAALREQDFRTEFVRSLIYSSQIVIQRAYLKNSPFVYKNFLPKDRMNFSAFAQLVRDRAIVPFLFRERSLRDNLEFDVSREGDLAVKTLLEDMDTITCVRLSVDEDACRRQCDSMETTFGSGLTRLLHLNGHQRNAMAEELFVDKTRLQEAGAWEAFNDALDALVDYAVVKTRALKKDKQVLGRKDVYKDNFVFDLKDSAIHGQFRKPDRDNPFLLQLKKYVDLIYNVNLPDHLKRYTFTPENMPSRMALQDPPREGFSDGEVREAIGNRDGLEAIQRAFMAHSQKAMSLPLLRDLSVADVLDIRALPQWSRFRDAQTAVLRNPKECLSRIAQFQIDFDHFQRALSEWYQKRYNRKATEERYVSYVSVALNLGGKTIVAGSKLNAVEKVIAGKGVDFVVDHIPERIKTYAAKLMVGVYDIGSQELDADRSYSIEMMQANTDLAREDIVELLRLVTSDSADALPPTTVQMADQGVQ